MPLDLISFDFVVVHVSSTERLNAVLWLFMHGCPYIYFLISKFVRLKD